MDILRSNTEICNSFNKHAKDYQKAAAVQIEIGTRLFNRLDYFKFQPAKILDLGCGPGYFSDLLHKKYPNAEIISLDIAIDMLQQAKLQSHVKQDRLINADAGNLPFGAESFDLIFANQVIHWIEPMQKAFVEIFRVLKLDGLLLFSTLGPNSLYELKNAWASVDAYAHTHDFLDMHDIGDMLLAANFADPVVDSEYITVRYPSQASMLKSIKSQGVRNISPDRKKGLTTPGLLKEFEQALPKTQDNKYPLTYEVVYGHAIKSTINTQQETFITLEELKKTILG